MDKKLDLTDAEWSVMEQLWAAPGSTGRALTAALEQKTGWSRSTTLTLLRRLAEKGAVRYEDSGKDGGGCGQCCGLWSLYDCNSLHAL